MEFSMYPSATDVDFHPPMYTSTTPSVICFTFFLLHHASNSRKTFSYLSRDTGGSKLSPRSSGLVNVIFTVKITIITNFQPKFTKNCKHERCFYKLKNVY
jgi:hypothetical protein